MDETYFDSMLQRMTPRTKYSYSKRANEDLSLQMLTGLNRGRMEMIRDQFRNLDDCVDLYEFVHVMEKCLPKHVYKFSALGEGHKQILSTENFDEDIDLVEHEISRHDIIGNLVELFREVDINGDGVMEWDEFSRFLVEKARVFHSRSDRSNYKFEEYRHTFQSNVEEITGIRHSEKIEKLCFLEKQKYIAVIEEYSRVATIYNPRTWTSPAKLRHKAPLLGMAYCRSKNCLATCCSDMNIYTWNLDEGQPTSHYTELMKWPAPSAQVSMVWSDDFNILYSGGMTGDIHGWDIDERIQTCKLSCHTDIVMELICVSALDNMMSGSLDKTICIWDLLTHTLVHKIEGHTKGICSLSYSDKYRCLVSCGFEHEVYVWSSFSRRLITTLKGHHSSLLGCHCVPDTPELITVDVSGLLKVWDIRNFKCIQTWSSSPGKEARSERSGCSSFLHCKLPATKTTQSVDDFRMIAAQKSFMTFDQLRSGNDPTTDDFAITAACFNATSLTILTCAESNVRIWDAVTGKLKNEFLRVCENDISAACLDDRERKFIVGDSHGHICICNYQNGVHMKRLPSFPHHAPILSLIYCPRNKTVLATSTARMIRVYDELDPDKALILRCFDDCEKFHKEDISAVAYSGTLGLVASADPMPEDGLIIVYEFETGKYEMKLNLHEKDAPPHDPISVLCLQFLDPYPFLMASCSDGYLRMWGIRFAQFKGSCLLEWRNESAKNYMAIHSSCDTVKPLHSKRPGQIYTMAWNEAIGILYTGDEYGLVQALHIQGVLRALKAPRVEGNMRKIHNTGGNGIITQAKPIHPVSVRIEWIRRAHEDIISILHLIRENGFLLTSSSDRLVKMWSVTGDLRGELVPEGDETHYKRRANWNFEFDVEARQAQEEKDIELVDRQITIERKLDTIGGNTVPLEGPLGSAMDEDECISEVTNRIRAKHRTKRKGRKSPWSKAPFTKSLPIVDTLSRRDTSWSNHSSLSESVSIGNVDSSSASNSASIELTTRRSQNASKSASSSLPTISLPSEKSLPPSLPSVILPSPGRTSRMSTNALKSLERLEKTYEDMIPEVCNASFSSIKCTVKDFEKDQSSIHSTDTH